MRSSLVPASAWLARYERPWLRADVVAGLTTAAVVVPKAMAYATIAGLPLQVGLFTALVPMAVYPALGTSRPLSVSTTTTLGILCAAALADVYVMGRKRGTDAYRRRSPEHPEALTLVQGSPLGARLGRDRMFFTVPQAVERYLEQRAA